MDHPFILDYIMIAYNTDGNLLSVLVIVLGLLIALFVVLRWYLSSRRRKRAEAKRLQMHNELLLSQNKELIERLSAMESSLTHAAKIQQAIFLDEHQLRLHFPNSFLLQIPRNVISGDFCWVKLVGNKRIVAVGDCTGHGFPGAYISSLVYHCLEKVVDDFGITQLDLIMEELNFYFLETFKYHKKAIIDEGIDIALAAFTEGEDYMEFCGASNGFLLIRNGEAFPVKAASKGINTKYEFKDIFYSSNHEIKKGDMLYFFSDGFRDQFGGAKGKRYMTRRLHLFLTKLASEPVLTKQRSLLLHEFKTWRGNEAQVDDVTVLGIRI